MSPQEARSYRRLRRLSSVYRWGVVPTLRRQSVAEHSFHVAWIARWLLVNSPVAEHLRWEGMNETDWLLVVNTSLYHDDDEALSGDLPGRYKTAELREALSERTQELGVAPYTENPRIKLVVKLADLLEALLFLREEEAMGNRTVGAVQADVANMLNKVWSDSALPLEQCYFTTREFLAMVDPCIHPLIEAAELAD